MQNLKLFSVVQREASKQEDVYQYSVVPRPLRVQVFNIACGQLGSEYEFYNRNSVRSMYAAIVTKLCDEYGIYTLQDKEYSNQRRWFEELHTFLNVERNSERFLDAVQLIAHGIEAYSSSYNYQNQSQASVCAANAIELLNRRMKENAFGFQYVGGAMLRIDSEYLHSEAVIPSLRLLNINAFAGPQAEFMNAHEHLRNGRNKEAMNEALKAFESTMKAICTKREWQFDANKATAAPLINLCFEKG